jgi:hypothetical protein
MRHPRQWPAELRAIIVGFEPVMPKTPRGKVTYKVKFESGTEAKKVLAAWKGMIGGEKDDKGDGKPNPLAIGGEADVDALCPSDSGGEK